MLDATTIVLELEARAAHEMNRIYCFVPYAQLPPEQQQKDHLFLTAVRAMAAALNWASTG